MASEYKLSYTAPVIDAKLKEIDNLAKRSELPTKTSELTNDSGFLTSIPSEYVTETELNNKGYLTAVPNEYITETELNAKGYLTAAPVTSVNNKTGAITLTAADVNARPASWTPSYSDVGADVSGAASSAVSTHNTKTDAHNDIRLLIGTLTTRLDALANSDDNTLDQMAEVVAYIKSNRNLIEQVTTGKVSVSDIIDNLTTNVANKPLSAAQGVALKALIDAITIPTKLSQLTNDKGYLTSFTETDPTVPTWAKATNKPSYTSTEIATDFGNVSSPLNYVSLCRNVTDTFATLDEALDGQNSRILDLTSAKLDASALPTAIDTALAEAKASGEFNGADGQRGTGLLPVTTAPSGYTTAVGGITPKYRMAISTIKTQSGATEVLLGDTIRYSYYHYPIDYLDSSYAYCETRTSIRGATGAAYTLTDEDKTTIVNAVTSSLATETWTFTLKDGSTVTKKVVLG